MEIKPTARLPAEVEAEKCTEGSVQGRARLSRR